MTDPYERSAAFVDVMLAPGLDGAGTCAGRGVTRSRLGRSWTSEPEAATAPW
ncbi:hypothetical protein ACIBP6_10460 [Nonomuraea terrae]|uniref:hypothetical protein n=1 Tax=Nonomuraea terrae TaxID=2530383 RepID=UPI0037BD3C76